MFYDDEMSFFVALVSSFEIFFLTIVNAFKKHYPIENRLYGKLLDSLMLSITFYNVSFCSFKFHFKRASFEHFHASIQFCEHKAFNVQKAKFSLLNFFSACTQCCFLRLGTWTQRCVKASWKWIAFDSWYLGDVHTPCNI